MRKGVAAPFFIVGILLYAAAFVLDRNVILFVLPTFCLVEGLALLVFPQVGKLLWGLVLAAILCGLASSLITSFQTENGMLDLLGVIMWGIFFWLPASGLGIYLYKAKH
jgi:hypothetical protein